MNLLDIKDKFHKKIGNVQSLIIILVVILFIIAALVIYRKSVVGRMNKKYVPNNEFNKSRQGIESVDLYFFFTEWCPHCKTAKPIWFDFKKDMEGKKVNGVSINFFEIDCDKDTETSDKFNVKGFPTIKMMKGNQIIEYDAKPSKETLHEFVKSSLN
jgi:thiol-disulfide isomerase/thioredoxin